MYYPCHYSTELNAAMTRPHEREVPGSRLVQRPDFYVTQEPAPRRDTIAVGEVLDSNRRPAGPLVLPLDSLNRHVFVSGATGSGKSQTGRKLLVAPTRRGIPSPGVEPAKPPDRLRALALAVGGP